MYYRAVPPVYLDRKRKKKSPKVQILFCASPWILLSDQMDWGFLIVEMNESA
jgi:hypothetical protein